MGRHTTGPEAPGPPRPPGRRRPLLLGAAVLIAAGAVTGGVLAVRHTGSGSPAAPPAAAPAAPAAPAPSTSAEAPPPPEPASRCPALVAAMPPRERLAQRLLVGVDAATPAATRAMVASDKVGGVFLGGNATRAFTDGSLTELPKADGGRPVMVSVDDEGGRVQRIDDLVGSLPSARAMAAGDGPAKVRALAAQRGRQLKARGVTVDLAPVLDVGSQPAGAVIGDRSFSPDPAKVAVYAGAFADGLRDAGVLPVFKHFPGHGRADGDSHKGAVSTPPVDDLRRVDLVPYRTVLSGGKAAVMVGHLDVPGLTGGLPATLSPAAYRMLRQEVGFDGLVMTDDLGAMKAISDRYDLPVAVATALGAGADMALWSSGGRVDEVLDRLQAAAAAGKLPDSDAAVARVLAAKGMC
jgi:beta-N-acetylhexosaminidase